MNKEQKIKNNQKGATLTLVLVFSSILMIILGGLFGYTLMLYRANRVMIAREQAFHIAESGLEYYRWYLAHATEGMTEAQQFQFWAEGTIGYPEPYIGDFYDEYGTLVGHFQIEINPPLAGGNNLTIKSIGWTEEYPSAKRTIEIRKRRPSWGEYAILINHRARLPEEMVIRGKAHSNEDLRVEGTIYNLATASETTHPDPDSGQEVEPGVWTTGDPNSVFLGGWEDNAPIIDFNALTSKLETMKSLTEGTNYYYGPPQKSCWPFPWFCLLKKWNPAGYIIELNENATIDFYRAVGWSFLGTYLPSFDSSEFIGNFPWPENRVVFTEATSWVKGTVNANQISIGAANLVGAALPGENNLADIIIQGNILYNDSQAKVGLIAQDNIMIDRYAGDPDLEVNAALVAKEGWVGREDLGNQLGTLTINGSIAANYLAEFGGEYCFWQWCWAAGFENVELIYDSNLLFNPPPYFPTKDIFQTDMWEEAD